MPALPVPAGPALLQGSPPLDWVGVGIVLSVVGGFLLANAILFRHPKSLVEEHFRGSRPSLGAIRDYVFHRVQVHLGFLFLLVGFGLQLFGRYTMTPRTTPEFPMVAVGVSLLAVIALEAGGWWLSHALFRRYVREDFLRHPPDFETDTALAREVGALFGMRSSGEETVTSYAERLRRELGLPDPGRRVPRAPRVPLGAEPEEDPI